MISKNDQNIIKLNDYLMEKLWSTYIVIDTSRKKTFYQLIFIILTYIILWYSRNTEFELPLIKIKVSIGMAFSIAPLFLWIVLIRYLYFCSHTIVTYMAFHEQFIKYNQKELEILGYNFIKLHSTLKARDLTENLNVYLFPIISSRHLNTIIKKSIVVTVNIFSNITIILSICIPFVMYCIMVNWFSNNYLLLDNNVLISRAILFSYIVMIVFLLFAIFYFYQRSKTAVAMYNKFQSPK